MWTSSWTPVRPFRSFLRFSLALSRQLYYYTIPSFLCQGVFGKFLFCMLYFAAFYYFVLLLHNFLVVFCLFGFCFIGFFFFNFSLFVRSQKFVAYAPLFALVVFCSLILLFSFVRKKLSLRSAFCWVFKIPLCGLDCIVRLTFLGLIDFIFGSLFLRNFFVFPFLL